ncbi:MAG: membrane protein of unknown function [Candidatus Thorarchaeota archaeon]|nr:MAG: membrane protein of unknown function [Candidatus Thorarchaeota archaeon]
MFEMWIVGPVISILATVNVLIHLYEDWKILQENDSRSFAEPSTTIDPLPMAVTVLSTLLSFGIVLVIIVEYLFGFNGQFFGLMIPLLDPPFLVWFIGFLLVSVGIVLHAWSRYVRQDMATSWALTHTHVLITKGPYSKIRHPSYSAYFLCFIGLFLLIPSVMTLMLLVGFYGYHEIAITEEKLLLDHFGDEYRDYMYRTGRFLPFSSG